MPNVNRVTVMGVLGRDLETKTSPMVAALPHSAWQHRNIGKTKLLVSVKRPQNGTESPLTIA